MVSEGNVTAFHSIDDAPNNYRVLVYGKAPEGHDEMAMAWRDRIDGRWYHAPNGGYVEFTPTLWCEIPEPNYAVPMYQFKPRATYNQSVDQLILLIEEEDYTPQSIIPGSVDILWHTDGCDTIIGLRVWDICKRPSGPAIIKRAKL